MPEPRSADAYPRVRLDEAELRRRVVTAGTIWTALEVVDSLESSNVTLAERAKKGARGGEVLVAEEQTAGRGRRDRSWSAPQYSSVMVSVLVRPAAEPSGWGWVPLLTALAVVDAVRPFGVSADVKWPNDILVGGRKLAGVLCEVVPTAQSNALIVGWGINVDQHRDELPGDAATSLRLEGAAVDRAGLLLAVLSSWESWYRRWEAGDGRLSTTYAHYLSTLGQEVRLHLPDGSQLVGTATGLDPKGGLVVIAAGREHVVAAADVVHLRPETR